MRRLPVSGRSRFGGRLAGALCEVGTGPARRTRVWAGPQLLRGVGVTTDLAYVSPRTGRAVSRAAGMPHHDKLCACPIFCGRTRLPTRLNSTSA